MSTPVDRSLSEYIAIDPATLESRQAYKLQTSIIVPRPIAWVGTVGKEGTYNCAPFSYFMGVSSHPPVIAFAVGERRSGVKDTVRNIEAVPEFTVNVVTESQAEAMVHSSADAPYGESEFELAGLNAVPSDLIRAPRIGGAPVQMECRAIQVSRVPETTTTLILGKVLRLHIARDVIDPATGTVDVRKLKPVGRLGGTEYCRITDLFDLDRP
jgi:flavin reductase (DIM6/NTAB) family NADH-FMN oxidoreductase RutF